MPIDHSSGNNRYTFEASSLADLGGHARCMPLYRTQSFHFCIHFHQKMFALGAPPIDEYTTGFQIRPTLVLNNNSPLLAPLMTEESTLKAVFQPPELPKPTEDKASDGETPVSQVTPLLGTTPRENHQLQYRNTPDNMSDILGTCVYQWYVETPLQTLDGIIVNQPK